MASSLNNFSDLFQRDLQTRIIGRPLLHYTRVGSTNDLVRTYARDGHPEGLVILADEQTTGRGRQGRGWIAPADSSLLFSLLLRPTWLAPSDAFALTMMAGVSLCEAIEESVGIQAALKWPNDLMLSEPAPAPSVLRKAAGILSELEIEHEQIAWVVIGMGINVNWSPSGVVDGRDLAEVATSVSLAAGHLVDRVKLLQTLLTRMDIGYQALYQGHHEALFNAWRKRLTTIGQSVRLQLMNGELFGTAEDVTLSGALQLRDEHGLLHEITAGDVDG